ncbi:glycerol:H symporter (Gup1), putative [Talaromyces stipitatus ATCC 10500]|uniref:Glycerol:H symporter (Gup1), putative n=1 Tax=Talaromyces stipitatus (strain ATCC 10500 / CBS 375.48 / QM 6759 / NRRL 1006) TaxID=441959 RepID=B8LT11_TALSN|nr:glycerol:H symporter (Gup1), putative [Talaromyces stipitatus ATCC 10500]EED23519.1 glycerol:H symporter (Gup1), putative [Talaromyces stipitatus ATCC 10500]
MGSLLQGLQRLYSLDTLDTRLTTSFTTPIKYTAQDTQQQPSTARDPTAGKDARAQEIASNAQPSKWNTPEFYFYYFVFITVVPMMFKTVIDISQPDHPAYAIYADLLSPGWIPGRKVDNSDAQYASFRDNILYLFLLLIVHPLLRRVYNYFNSISASTNEGRKSAGDARVKQRTIFDFNFAILFLMGLHGISIVKILLILFVNYKIVKGLPRAYIPAATWIFNLIVLFANELCDGYPLASIARFFVSSEVAAAKGVPTLVAWAEFLDGFGGLMPRWQISFKFTILRLISFNMDYYWSLGYPSDSPIEKKQIDPASLSERDRLTIPADLSSYNGLYYAAYVLYSPLYLAGPIVTFNDYISQQRYPSPALTPTRNLLYGIRFCLTLLCMELILHFIYAVAISKSTSDWSIYTPGQLSMLSYFNLNIIWLKLLIPWRFFRLWALLDGVDPPENMVRCMSNNYSALAFWRSWHRSYHLWVVRYLYVPLGGRRDRRQPSPSSSASKSTTKTPSTFLSRARGIFNQLIVFTFVAVWHDINLRLLMWGWLITFFVLPEVIATLLFPASRWRSHPDLYRIICGIGAVGNIIPMMAAHLIGFAIGLDGLKGLLAGIFGSWTGLAFMLGACGALFVGVQVMFEIREGEKRRGIKLSY